MALKPYAFQKEGILDLEDFLRNGGGALLADDMGLGKTISTLWLLKRGRAGDMFPALVVCPANVKYGWEHTAGVHADIRAQVLEGKKPPKGGLGSELPKLTIINPDILPAWLPHLRTAGFKTFIMDESQFFSNPNSKRTRAAFDLARSVPYRIALSGTPLMNAPAELWPTLYMLRPDKFKSLWAFADLYCKPRMMRGRWQFKGARNLDKLHTSLRRILMVRRLKEDVEIELPKKNRVVVPMELSNRAEYEHAKSDFLGWLRKNYRNDKGRINRAAKSIAVSRVGYLLRLAARLKARAVVDWANRFLTEYPEEKLVLFGVHRKMVDVLCRRVPFKSVVIDGSVTGKHRGLAVQQFRKDAETRVCIGNMRAMGVGVDGLQDVCKNAAFAEMWWVPGVHGQAEDRIYRMGQTGVSWIHYLVSGGTIEEHLCKIVQTKQATIHAALDGKEDTGSMDVHDLLIAALEGEKNGR